MATATLLAFGSAPTLSGSEVAESLSFIDSVSFGEGLVGWNAIDGENPPALNVIRPLKLDNGRLRRTPTTDAFHLQNLGIGVDPTTDAVTVKPGATDRRAVVIKGIGSQASNLLEVQTSTEDLLFTIGPCGNVTFKTRTSGDAWVVSTGANQMVNISGQAGKEAVAFGNTTTNPAVVVKGTGPLRGANGVGTDKAGTTLTIAGGQGTGTGTGGSVVISTAPAGTTGFTENALSTVLTIDEDGLGTWSRGDLLLEDSIELRLGTGADVTVTHNGTNTLLTSATGDFTIDNTNATGSTIMQLGTDTSATDFQVQNDTGTSVLTINGASQIGFFNTTPAGQQTDIGALTDNTGGTADNTVAAVSGSGDDTTINNNFADLIDQINQLRTTLRNLGLMA